MTDELVEGAPAPEESKGLAVPEISAEEREVQQPSEKSGGLTEARVLELLGTQLKALDEKIESLSRQAQSAKDRAISKTAKELADLKARLDAAGGDWNTLAREAEAQTLYQRLDGLEARLSQAPASQPTWQAEWDTESRKVLDAASKFGITLTTEEYNAAFFGKKFKAKGDAYAALNAVIIAKAKGESISAAAVATEGGEVARPPEPTTPKPFRQKVNDALAAGKSDEARKLIDKQWEAVEKEAKVAEARRALAEAGVSPADLA